jgi:lysophospholipase L1-like esterase
LPCLALALGLLCQPVRGNPQAGNRIVLIGSSIAAGVGASTYDSAWAGRYAKHLPTLAPAWQLTNLAVPGYTTYHVMPKGWKTPAGRPAVDTAHNLTKALSLKPDVLLISLTGNDISNGYAASEYEANFDSLHAIATRAGVAVWITTPLPRTANDSAKRRLVSALRTRILSRYAPRALDFYEGLGDAAGAILPKYNSGDNIHPNNAGHALLFSRVRAADIPGKPTAILRSASGRPASLGLNRSGARLSWISQDGKPGDALGRLLAPSTVDTKGRF